MRKWLVGILSLFALTATVWAANPGADPRLRKILIDGKLFYMVANGSPDPGNIVNSKGLLIDNSGALIAISAADPSYSPTNNYVGQLGILLDSSGRVVLSSSSVSNGFVYIGTFSGIPGSCTIGQISFITDTTAGSNQYYCTASNTWTQQNSSGGPGSVGNGSQYNLFYYNGAGTTSTGIGLPGSSFNPATGYTLAAPTGTGVGLSITGDSHQNNILEGHLTGGGLGFWGDYLGGWHATSGDFGSGLGQGCVQLFDPTGTLGVDWCGPNSNMAAKYEMDLPATPVNGLMAFDGGQQISFVAPNPNTGNGLISGCGVDYSTTALTADVAACNYTIAGNSYSLTSPPSTVTFNTNTSGSPRIDVVVVKDDSTAAVVEGTPATNPGVPSIIPTTEIAVGQVTIADSATAPSVTNELVYDEAVGPAAEWTVTSSGASIVVNSTANPYHLTTNVQGTNVAAGAWWKLVRGSGTVNIVGSVLNFYLDPNAVAWAKNKGITITAYSGAALVGTAVTLNNGAFAFNTAKNAYQQMSIAGNVFGTGGTPIDTFLFTITGGGANIPSFSFDYFNIQSGQTVPPPVTVPPIYRTASMVFGADNASAALVDADIAPQLNMIQFDQAGTVYEIDVIADDGTPNVVVQRNHLGTAVALLSSALATAGSGAVACSNVGGSKGLNGTTTCSSTLENTAVGKGDWIGTTTATAGGVAKKITVVLHWTEP